MEEIAIQKLRSEYLIPVFALLAHGVREEFMYLWQKKASRALNGATDARTASFNLDGSYVSILSKHSNMSSLTIPVILSVT